MIRWNVTRASRDRSRNTKAVTGHRTPKSCELHLIRASFSLSPSTRTDWLYNIIDKLKFVGHYRSRTIKRNSSGKYRTEANKSFLASCLDCESAARMLL